MKKNFVLFFTRPFTFMLVILFRVISAFRKLPPCPDRFPPPSSVLIFSTTGIGDTLSDTPAIHAVKARYPEAQVTVVVHRKRKAILEGNPWIDHLIPHRKNLFTFFATLGEIRRRRPDLAVVLRANDPDIWPLAYLSGAAAVVSRPDNTVFPFLINCPVSIPRWADMPGVLQTMEIVKRIGADSADPKIVYRVTADERRNMEVQLLAGNPPPLRGRQGGGTSIGNPPSNFPHKGGRDQMEMRVAVQVHHSPRLSFRDWPADSFLELCRAILEEFPVKIYLTGGPEDADKAASIAAGLDRVGLRHRCVNRGGMLSLRDAAALIEQCAFMVTTDTGLMHLGFALDVPTLAILHPYNAHRVGPYGYGNRHRALVMPGPDRDESGRLRPLSTLPPGAVLDVFRQMYQEAGP